MFHLFTPPRSKLCLLCFRAASLPVLAGCLLAVLLTMYTGLQLDPLSAHSASCPVVCGVPPTLAEQH